MYSSSPSLFLFGETATQIWSQVFVSILFAKKISFHKVKLEMESSEKWTWLLLLEFVLSFQAKEIASDSFVSREQDDLFLEFNSSNVFDNFGR